MAITSEKLVLVIEDNLDDFEMTVRALRKSSITNPVLNFETGEESLEYLYQKGRYANNPKHQRPSLILLDINMPGMNGIEVLKNIKNETELKTIPVIMLTTSKGSKDIQSCYDAGANSYMQKPVKFEGFLDAMKTMKNFWFELAVTPDEC